MSRWSFLGVLAVFAGFAASAARVEAQSLESCGNIYVEAGATCEVRPPSAMCEVMCEPVSFRAACAADAYVRCQAGCDVDIEAGCSLDCQAGCRAQCTATPAEFDCQAYCQGSCSGSCDAECGNDMGCRASCEATCSGDCSASCKVKPPTVDCDAECKASCEGSCHARATVDCQADCQSQFRVKCEADLQGGCEAQCMTDKGALFCEDQYVKTQNVDACIEALKSRLDVDVMYNYEADGMAGSECVMNNGAKECTSSASGTAKAGASCAALPGAAGGSAWLLTLVGLAAYRIRRRRQG